MAKIALDSSVIIYFFGVAGQFQDRAAELIATGNSGAELIVSELTFLELLAKSNFSDIEAQGLYEQSQKLPLRAQPVAIAVLLRAAKLRRQHNSIKTPDAIHLATAILRGCDYFVTNDHKLLKQKIPGIALISLAKPFKV
ncbi:MAG: type II toxin-antitoxin system VapC family toxin [Candidatus Saccharimonadales bacterium]